MNDPLPIQALRGDFLREVARGPVSLTAPTGSGKSTQAPRWLMAGGPVLVVEPRRVACRALASRVAELEGCRLGDRVGYLVRGEARARPDTRLLFATPGVVLRMMEQGRLSRFATLVLDEFHERSLDLDLIFALALTWGAPRLVLMSATMAGERVAAHMGGAHLRGEGRQYPVQVRHVPGGDRSASRFGEPDLRGLESRVERALDLATADPGDVLVFLPGKGEIASVAAALRRRSELDLLPLHGALSLQEQGRVFSPGGRRRVILATNVAETSLTLPRIGVVIDSGLVRRTHYHGGRGYLALSPIARDSASQRAGRAGRLGPGMCYRLWREDYPLEPVTPPEIHRESLVPLVLAAAACGAPALDLPFLDPPRGFAVQAAREHLQRLGALEASGAVTPRGRQLFGLPLDPHLGRLLVEAQARGTLHMAIDLCAGLDTTRPLFGRRPDDPDLDLRDAGCDAVALIRALREGQPQIHGLSAQTLAEARRAARRHRRIWGLDADAPPPPMDRRALAMTLLAAWPDCAHVARRRKRHVAWSNGGTELVLGRDSAVDEQKTEALLVLDSRAFRKSHTRKELVITAAMPVPIPWLVKAGRGRERLAVPLYRGGRLLARSERVYAGKVLATHERVPQGALAREAVRDLFLAGRLFKGHLREVRRRHEAAVLAARLAGREPLPPLEEWLMQRLEALGLEDGADLDLLSGQDLLPSPLPEDEQRRLEARFPQDLSIGDAVYRIRYDVPNRTATLHQVSGTRKTPPGEMYWPRLPGWKLQWEYKRRVRTLRG